MNIFEGIRVIDCTKVYSGPLATRMFADYGAEVIKVENPTNPDDARLFPPLKNGTSGYFETLNRNKKFVSLDLKEKTDLEKFYKLIKSADIFVENMTPDTKYKLLIDYNSLKKINPRLIYASLSGVGQDQNRKYYDVLAQAESGLISLSGTKDNPVKIGPAVVDAFSGMTLSFAIASALYYRQKTGKGQFLDVTMIAASMNLLENNLAEYWVNNTNPERPGNFDNALAPFGLYKTKDGQVALAIGNNMQWSKFITIFEKANFESNMFGTNSLRLINQNNLTLEIEKAFASYSSEEIIKMLDKESIPCALVSSMSDIAKNKIFFDKKVLIKYKHQKLGDYIAPGRAINFSESSEFPTNPTSVVGADNKTYGI